METSKTEYVIGNEKGFFIFGNYVPTWYAGRSESGDPVFKVSDAEVFRTRKAAEKVLTDLPSGYAIIGRAANG